MRHIKDMNIGDRFTISKCLLDHITTYTIDREGQEVRLFRHAIRTPDNTKLVYTGARELGRPGKHYDITATIKRYENRFSLIRISRPIFRLHIDDQTGMNL